MTRWVVCGIFLLVPETPAVRLSRSTWGDTAHRACGRIRGISGLIQRGLLMRRETMKPFHIKLATSKKVLLQSQEGNRDLAGKISWPT